MRSLVRVGGRNSPLSLAQIEEVRGLMDIDFECITLKTLGDKDLKTSLRGLEKSNFFTKELDDLLLRKEIDIAIHSAKDLPEPLPKGLKIVAITKGVDPRDALVFNELKDEPLIGTSSYRREESVLKLFPKATFEDIRGTIHERLSLLSKLDGVVVAESALIRLKLTHLKRLYLEDYTPLQGRLAIVAREDDLEMEHLFKVLHA